MDSNMRYVWSRCSLPGLHLFVNLALVGKDIVFRFIVEYIGGSLRDFGPYVVGLFLIQAFLKDDILAYVETWD